MTYNFIMYHFYLYQDLEETFNNNCTLWLYRYIIFFIFFITLSTEVIRKNNMLWIKSFHKKFTDSNVFCVSSLWFYYIFFSTHIILTASDIIYFVEPAVKQISMNYVFLYILRETLLRNPKRNRLLFAVIFYLPNILYSAPYQSALGDFLKHINTFNSLFCTFCIIKGYVINVYNTEKI